MKILHKPEGSNGKSLGPLGVTIGNFDGVHTGHLKLLSEIRENTRSLNLSMMTVTFSPHPRQIMSPVNNFLISSEACREQMLAATGCDYLYKIDFNRDLSVLTPDAFIKSFLLDQFEIKKFYLGHDFGFGVNKSGGIQFMQNICEEMDILVALHDQHYIDDIPVSSSVIREKIQQGEMAAANKLLGRQFNIIGSVIKGEGRGRGMGFPTANLEYPLSQLLPSNGVYISKTTIGDMTYHSVTNVGENPTFDSDCSKVTNIETHLLDFDRDIYGEHISVEFVKHLRPERSFNSVNELIAAIKLDIVATREHYQV
ncbi:MAG: bifunctional riboflavin kinase/FAD synthetase [Bdellovibrionales bacterium]|jgi:riboflavin kinase / FMN adenylyltransferase|nr:bifunctional riboflavin kinase/FAD synthetase [Bdellovibrionales bacterium]MBT3526093.1 bifunctional riboflavin kinase/FAD synthetase [Bdellovibrionales bacterium]MBT7668217.1 bifunctional riboflavin kinase/FAD synthetase [Bdellovibrionales bacterium]MBT7766466.1 bifunctional riboflavin kinase/FAD synthetase [Bdellovibrionales bacterium]